MSIRRRSSEGGLTCAVCLEAYNQEERRPLMLPACGHTFCRICLVGVLSKETVKGKFLCPNCRRAQPIKVAEDLPTNYSLLELTLQEAFLSSGSASNAAASPSSFDNTSMDERCSEHGSRLAFWCTTCEVAACGECLFEGHPRPEHNLARVEDHIHKLQELMDIRSTRIVTQLRTVCEQNVSNIKEALAEFMDLLRQKRSLNKLLDDAMIVRNIAKNASDLGCLSSVNEALKSLEKEFTNAQIDTELVVSVRDPLALKGVHQPKKYHVISSPLTDDVKTEVLIDLQALPCSFPDRGLADDSPDQEQTASASQTRCTALNYSDPTPGVIASFPAPLEVPNSELPVSKLSSSKAQLTSKPPLPTRPAIIPKPRVSLPFLSSPAPNIRDRVQPPNTDSYMVSASTQTTHHSNFPRETTNKCAVHEVSSQTENPGNSKTAADRPPWPHLLCGTLSSNWTASKITLEPRGIHVYSLGPMKEKCDVLLNLSLITSLAPIEAPTVFLDLQEGARPLGRVYIALQIHLRRAQQFFSLCLGDRGPSYQGSFFHSVLRKSDSGEGLAGGDYEGKAGKGGSAVLMGIEPNIEIGKRCERGMVSRLSTRSETSAQFCISIKDGPRAKPVYPFGRVCQGINVIDEACRRPALSVSIANCGCVLPLL